MAASRVNRVKLDLCSQLTCAFDEAEKRAKTWSVPVGETATGCKSDDFGNTHPQVLQWSFDKEN